MPDDGLATGQSAWTLPGSWYFDPAIYERERTEIFHRTWQYVGHVSSLSQPGSYAVRDINDQTVFVVRDGAELRAFHNVCQHRAHRLLEGTGELATGITCPYHQWRYGLDGTLLAARGSSTVEGFSCADITLAPVAVDQICGFVFVNLDPEAAPMAEVYPGLEDDILRLAPSAAELKCAQAQSYEISANWKNSIENYSECYHCPARHRSLVNEALDITTYRIDVHENYHRHVTRGVGDRQGYRIDADRDDEFGSWFVWPNMVFEVFPGGNLTAFNHVPTGPEHTVQETEWFFANDTPSAAEQGVIDFVQVVRLEDIPICENVQRGLHSRGYTQGRLIIDADRTDVSEHAVQDFQMKVRHALARGHAEAAG